MKTKDPKIPDCTKRMGDRKDQKHFNIIYCPKCDVEFDSIDFKDHLREKHNYTKEGLDGTKQAVMHADGRDFFTWVYEVTIKGVKGIKFQQSIKQPRSKESRKMWGEI